jgi:ribulose-5-phosphate 4-epimerase/fuculose-1-phosphate aldolase
MRLFLRALCVATAVSSCGSPAKRDPPPALAAASPPAAAPSPPQGADPALAGPLDDLVLASRILADQSVVDAFGHVSVRHPARPDHFLMSRAVAPALVTADDIVEYDLEGTAVDARGRAPFLERFIHCEIYRKRPDVTAIVHSHSPSVIAFGVTSKPLLAMFHNAAFLAGGVPVFDIREKFGDTDLLVRSGEIGRVLAERLGDRPVVLLRGHGSVATGPTLPLAVFRAIYTETDARVELQAIGIGGAINPLSVEEGRKADQINAQIVGRAWDLWKRRVVGADR